MPQGAQSCLLLSSVAGFFGPRDEGALWSCSTVIPLLVSKWWVTQRGVAMTFPSGGTAALFLCFVTIASDTGHGAHRT